MLNVQTMALTHAQPKRWTIEEFYRLFDVGLLSADERYELIEGEIVRKAGHNPPHIRGITNTVRLFCKFFDDSHSVNVQVSILLGLYSAPEPDVFLTSREAYDAGLEPPYTTSDL